MNDNMDAVFEAAGSLIFIHLVALTMPSTYVGGRNTLRQAVLCILLDYTVWNHPSRIL
jgi:hypothetical protein